MGRPRRPEPTASNGSTAASSNGLLVEQESSEPNYVTPAFLHDVEAELREIDEKARRMLAYYVEQGPDTPLNAHFSAGGSGDRTSAYAYNRQLRLGGFIEHAGCGRYEPVLRQLVSDEAPANVSAPDIADAVVDPEKSSIRRRVTRSRSFLPIRTLRFGSGERFDQVFERGARVVGLRDTAGEQDARGAQVLRRNDVVTGGDAGATEHVDGVVHGRSEPRRRPSRCRGRPC